MGGAADADRDARVQRRDVRFLGLLELPLLQEHLRGGKTSQRPLTNPLRLRSGDA